VCVCVCVIQRASERKREKERRAREERARARARARARPDREIERERCCAKALSHLHVPGRALQPRGARRLASRHQPAKQSTPLGLFARAYYKK
jgi:hypothetical protein